MFSSFWLFTKIKKERVKLKYQQSKQENSQFSWLNLCCLIRAWNQLWQCHVTAVNPFSVHQQKLTTSLKGQHLVFTPSWEKMVQYFSDTLALGNCSTNCNVIMYDFFNGLQNKLLVEHYSGCYEYTWHKIVKWA